MNKIKNYVSNLFTLFIITLTLTPGLAFASTPASTPSPYVYNFDTVGNLPEGGADSDSQSPYWWVNSGAYLHTGVNGRGTTALGSLPATDPWRILYSANNPTDTDQGQHPQNIFRLLTRTKWQDARQEAYFVIDNNNLSASSNRNASNGLLLFNRYQDSDNLYYTGVRVDGSVVIKKKINGTYYTMTQNYGIYPGTYDRTTNPNLSPLHKWIGLRSEVTNEANGSVSIKVYIDKGWTGTWTLIASAVDDGSKYGGKALTNPGYGGIRTDFMDVEFENFRLRDI